ncbi:MAG: glycyl-radical enzyme activating protein, partial [Candidatus Latescibacteria bacterium]|nr:glycyl-radical enzyme activating protein [Candidatus Latescibacterota bacterium]
IDCGACVEACEHGARVVDDSGERVYHREACVLCGECVDGCYAEALVMHGREVCADEILDEVRKDASFYEESGGGVTFSGGEPLLQSAFVTALLKKCKNEGFHTAVDTCGMVRWEAFEKALPYVNLFLFDIKHMDAKLHEEYTGASNEQILENLRRLNDNKVSIEIRMPIIPTFNDDRETIEAAAALLGGMDSITAVRILPYHRLAGEKYISLGYENTLPKVDPPADEEMAEIAGWIRAYGLDVLL